MRQHKQAKTSTRDQKKTTRGTQRPALYDATASQPGSAEGARSAKPNRTRRRMEEEPTTVPRAEAWPPDSAGSAGGDTEAPVPASGSSLVNEETASAASAPTGVEPAHEKIVARAFQIFQQRGEAPGNPVADWLQAERELRDS